jgi:hypothetical protein
MSKPRKKRGNPDFQRSTAVPAPPTEEIESRLFELLSPGTFTNLKTVKDKERDLRSRVLTLPVMAAIILSIVYRQIHHLTDVVRALETENLLWAPIMQVSKQALSQRLNSLPSHLFLRLFEQVIERISAKNRTKQLAHKWAPSGFATLLMPGNPSTASGSPVAIKFSAVWIGDASTLEAIKKHLGQLQEKTGQLLAGKILMVVEAFTHCPIAVWYDADPDCHETTWWEDLNRAPACWWTNNSRYGFFWI